MKLIRLLTICISILFLSATGASAGDQSLAGYGFVGNTGGKQSKAEKFAEGYTDAKAGGEKAFNDFAKDTAQNGSKKDNEMFDNMNNGKTPGGKQLPKDANGNPQGFGGDPNDPGPTDWSDHNIKTDGKGNVTGFEEKDFEEKDADGDGEISDAERAEWKKKKDKENEENGGAPGEVPPVADWDKDGNGKPDKGFERWCWQCCPGGLNECHYGWPGNCDNGGSCEISEICHPADEIHDDVKYQCHTCEYISDWNDPCFEKGMYSTASCNSECSPINACHAIYFGPDGKIRTGTVTKDDFVCYQCAESVDQCAVRGYYSTSSCNSECDPVDACSAVYLDEKGDRRTGTATKSDLRCYECPYGLIEGCEDGLLDGGCPAYCSTDEKCVPSGDNCHSCEKIEEKDPCEGDEIYAGGCPGVCADDQNCFEHTVEGVQCHDCVLKECHEYEKFSDCAACSEDEVCFPVNEGTISCVECVKKLTCADFDLYESCDECDISSICEPHTAHSYPGGGGKEGEIQCYECKHVSDEDQCADGLLNGGCPAYCSTDEKCVPVGDKCHKCEKKPVEEEEECEHGYDPGACPGNCDSATEICTPDQHGCHICDDKPLVEEECKDSLEGGCPAYCSTDEKCVPVGDKCHNCEKKPVEEEEECEHGYDPGACPGNCDPATEVCTPDQHGCHICDAKEETGCTDDADCDDGEFCNGSETCWHDGTCVDGSNPCSEGETCNEEKDICEGSGIEEEECEHGYDPGGCPGNCDSATEICTPDQHGCHICDAKEETGCTDDADCDDGEFCNGPETCWHDGTCVDGSSPCSEGETCNEEKDICEGSSIEEEECEHGYDPGACPGNCDPATEICTPDQHGCHICDLKESVTDSCPDQGLPGACRGTCTSKQLCIPQRGPCHICMDVETIEIEYISIFVETPFGIYVLGKNKKVDLNAIADFDVSSVMGLARADSSAMSKVKGLMGSMMGANPLAMLGGSMNMGSLTSLLKQGMDDKKNRYGDDCFDDFAKPNFAKQSPTSSSELDKKKSEKNAKKKKKKKKEGEEEIDQGPRITDGPQEFGMDPQQALAIDGPILACGKSGREKALMVMDSSGNPIAKILQSQLKNNPNAITEAFQKAQGFNQKIQGMVQGGPKGILNSLRQKAISMATKKIKDIVFGKKGDPKTAVDPNDQFYRYNKKKKKKFLGFLGGGGPTNIMKGTGLALSRGGKGMAKKKVEPKDQWGIQRVGYLPRDNADSAWNIADGEEKNVIVAVVDSGIDFEHPDLPQYIWTNPDEIADNGIDDDGNGLIDDIHGWNFLEHNNDLTDKRGHGTHVAGIIAAKRNNSIGIAGINPGAIIMPIKVANGEGESNSLHIYQGINYAVNHGAQIINVSLGGRGVSRMAQSALDHAHKMGVFVVVASGNTGEYLGHVSPASVNHAFTVSAIDRDSEWSTISSVGPNVALLAPGEAILSLRSKDSFHKRAVRDPIKKLYFRQSGTSFSTPMVTATASLLLTKNPDLTPDQIEDILLNTANDMGTKGWDDHHGAGSLNATEALKAAHRTDFLTVKLDRFQKNLNKKKKLESVDIYATVRGEFEQFTVGLGKGKRATKFKRMAGPFTINADHAWVARIHKDNLRGSDDWVVNIEVKDKSGNIKSAQALLEFE